MVGSDIVETRPIPPNHVTEVVAARLACKITGTPWPMAETFDATCAQFMARAKERGIISLSEKGGGFGALDEARRRAAP